MRGREREREFWRENVIRSFRSRRLDHVLKSTTLRREIGFDFTKRERSTPDEEGKRGGPDLEATGRVGAGGGDRKGRRKKKFVA